MRLEIGGAVEVVHLADQCGKLRLRHVLLLQVLELLESGGENLVAAQGVVQHLQPEDNHEYQGRPLEKAKRGADNGFRH